MENNVLNQPLSGPGIIGRWPRLQTELVSESCPRLVASHHNECRHRAKTSHEDLNIQIVRKADWDGLIEVIRNNPH